MCEVTSMSRWVITTTDSTIDFDAIRRAVDLRELIEADLGPPGRSRKWICPFHEDHDPSLGLSRDGLRWRCWSCGAHGDVFDWLRLREGLDPIEAARRLDPCAPGCVRDGRKRRATASPGEGRSDRTSEAPRGATGDPVPIWQDANWQATVAALVRRAESCLWSPAGRAALDWLRARGLRDHTIGRFRLGWNPADRWTPPFVWPDGNPRGMFVPRGLLIPWLGPDGCYEDGPFVGANVRRLMPDPFAALPQGEDKCLALRGSTRGYAYPWPEVLPSQGFVPALICEGEFDALLAWQEAGHLVHAVTVGGANQTPHRSALVALVLSPWWLIATDRDAAGVEAARAWMARAPHKAWRVLLPHGKDLTEFHVEGGNIREWVSAELARIGAHEPACTVSGRGHDGTPGAFGSDLARVGDGR